MASIINASTAGVGGVVTTADNSGDLNIQSGGTTIVAITSSGATIQGLTVGKGGGAVSTNTAVGVSALAANTSGVDNTAIGSQALLTATAEANTAFGARALKNTTTGIQNTALGLQALRENTTGTSNVAVGLNALVLSTTGSYITAVGRDALFSNTTASNNTAVGYQAGYTNVTGANFAYFGYQAGYSSTGSAGTFLGFQAGLAVTTGASNTFVGAKAGEVVTTGAANTILGRYNGNQSSLDIRTASNYVVLSDGDGQPMAFWDGRRNLSVNSWYGGAMNINAYFARGVITAGDSGGGGITTSNLFNGNASTGFLHVVESGTTNYLIAAIFKRNSSTAPVVTVIASSVLSVLATNSGGTIAINGATTGANVKMRYIGYDVTF
jgi:hypothetical protein